MHDPGTRLYILCTMFLFISFIRLFPAACFIRSYDRARTLTDGSHHLRYLYSVRCIYDCLRAVHVEPPSHLLSAVSRSAVLCGGYILR